MPDDDRYEMRLAGSGGQGVILAGVIVAEAAAVFGGRNAAQTQSYGPEARGGACKSEVVISDGEIDYPKATHPHVLVALTQEACEKYAKDIRVGGILIADSNMVPRVTEGPYRIFSIPIIATAKEKLGRVIVANIVAIGALGAITGVVTLEALEDAVRGRVPTGTEQVNLRALAAGYEIGKQALAERQENPAGP